MPWVVIHHNTTFSRVRAEIRLLSLFVLQVGTGRGAASARGAAIRRDATIDNRRQPIVEARLGAAVLAIGYG
ncbi:hypothetical protein MAFF301560_03010 [Ralstonia solanacearum]|nr:hypothetical protein MAFF301560_03010 [Ralstonia solanacearum]BEU44954.1 hypothetical protein MAFF211519_02790 [Ralstonia pseudosolanacearum]